MSDFVVFVGPSLDPASLTDGRTLSFQPPASQGDIYRAARSGASAIGLIDGYFESVPAVWHKEILFALSRGVRVYGAASMGALRAAELHVYGMHGVGRIFEWYSSGHIDADDEVALAHGPRELGYVALSVPLVNVRATLDKGLADEVLDSREADRLLAAARRIHFKERSWDMVLSLADLAGGTRRAFHAWLPERGVDQKRADAMELVSTMATHAECWPGPHKPDFLFEETDAWLAGLETMEAISSFDRQVVDESRIDNAAFSELLASVEAVLLSASTPVPPLGRGGLSRLTDRFRIENGLQDRARFHDWLSRNRLDTEMLGSILGRRAMARQVLENSGEALVAELLAEIKLRGRYEAIAGRVRDRQQADRARTDTKIDPATPAR